MNKKKYLWLGLGVVVFLAIIILLLSLKTTDVNYGGENTQVSQPVGEEQDNALDTNTSVNANPVAVAPTNNSEKKTVVTEETPVVVPPASNLSAMPGSPDAPKQEVVVIDKIPAKAIKLEVSNKGFSPNTFSVKAGQSVTLALTSTDDSVHVFIFPTASLMALSTMVSGKETKTITFNAPTAGTYGFRDDIPTNRANTGNMIVK